MSNYTKTTDFEAKDSLPSGDSGKIIRGSEFETEFDNIATAIASKSDANNPTFTGTVTIDGLTVNGNTVLGNAASDTVTVTADIASNLLPSADDTYNLGAVGAEWNDLYVDGVAYIDTINFNGTAITATAAELNIMDGVTATTAELNIMDGVTATTAELNYVDGVTSAIQTQLNSKANLSGANFTGAIDVTGTVTADGLDVSTATGSSSPTPSKITIATTSTGSDWSTTNPWGSLAFYSADTSSGGAKEQVTLDAVASNSSGGISEFRINTYNSGLKERLRVSYNGDISFLEDSGTTAKFFWDSSEERLGIGTSSPSRDLSLNSSGTTTLQVTNDTVGTSTTDGFQIKHYTSGATQLWGYENSYMAFATNNAERLRIDSSGNVGIGVGTPQASLHIVNDASRTQFIASGTVGNDRFLAIDVDITGNEDVAYITVDQADALAFGEKTNDNDRSIANEHMRIDSSGNVGIGTSSPSTILHAKSASPGLLLQDSSQTGRQTQLTQAAGIAKIRSRNNASNGQIVFEGYTASTTSEYMRIDTSGNLLVSGTEANPTQNNTTDAISLHNAGLLRASTTNAAAPLDLNVKSRDGNIATFRKDGSTVGSIKSRAGTVLSVILDPRTGGAGLTGELGGIRPTDQTGDITDNAIDLGKSTGRFKDLYLSGGVKNSSSIYMGRTDLNTSVWIGNSTINPGESDGTVRDAAVDLGYSSGRWKDLYLSGGAYLGGVAAANKLDDYEEGTFTATLTPETSGTITLNSSFDKLAYTKIGRVVTITGRIKVSAVSSPVGQYVRLSLPFAIGNDDEESERPTGTVTLQNAAQDIDKYCIHPTSGTISYIQIGRTDNFASNAAPDFSGNELLSIALTYIT